MRVNENPYQPEFTTSVFAADHSASTTRFHSALWLLAYLYPCWLVASFYLTWLIAWIQLGRFPRPSLDDPKSIGGLMDIAYPVPGLLLLVMPVMTPLGLASSFFCPVRKPLSKRYAFRSLLVVFYIALCAMAWTLLNKDPGRVVEWWLD